MLHMNYWLPCNDQSHCKTCCTNRCMLKVVTSSIFHNDCNNFIVTAVSMISFKPTVRISLKSEVNFSSFLSSFWTLNRLTNRSCSKDGSCSVGGRWWWRAQIFQLPQFCFSPLVNFFSKFSNPAEFEVVNPEIYLNELLLLIHSFLELFGLGTTSQTLSLLLQMLMPSWKSAALLCVLSIRVPHHLKRL